MANGKEEKKKKSVSRGRVLSIRTRRALRGKNGLDELSRRAEAVYRTGNLGQATDTGDSASDLGIGLAGRVRRSVGFWFPGIGVLTKHRSRD